MRIASEGNILLAPYLVVIAASLGGPLPSAAAMSVGQAETQHVTVTPATPVKSEAAELPAAADDLMNAPGASSVEQSEMPSESCLATTICEVKERVRWRTSAWTPAFCHVVARAVLKASSQHHLPPALILAVMINESDLNENAIVTTYKNGRIYAKDGGLMGIRCVLDPKGRCMNPTPHGLPWQQVMSPVNNIMLGARELAYWRDVGGVERVHHAWKDRNGILHTQDHLFHCRHRDHAYWAHYNHGLLYLDHGRARHYPHRVAVLYYALLQAMNLDTKPLTSMVLTVRDRGQGKRTADRPVEARYRKLCQSIRAVGPRCESLASAALAGTH